MTEFGTDYEVRCSNCDVSFPVEAKRCIHCGGRLGKIAPRVQVGEGLAGFELGPGLSQGTPASEATREGLLAEEVTEAETPTGRFSFLRGGMTLVWIVLAALYSILRACGER